MQQILDPPTTSCNIPRSNLTEHFTDLYSGNRLTNIDSTIYPDFDVSTPQEKLLAETLTRRFTPAEVEDRLRRMSDSAPGPDGLKYSALSKIDPTGLILAAIFNACWTVKNTPASWKRSNTTLIYKKGDPGDINNWRPLAMSNTTTKLFAALIADRLTKFAVQGKRLGAEQKGFLHHEGCYEHNFVLQEILSDAQRTKSEVAVAWLDLANAFGSIPHEAIVSALAGCKIPQEMQDLLNNMDSGCTTSINSASGPTDDIWIGSGVKQGCPASPIKFNLAMQMLILPMLDRKFGYPIGGETRCVPAYADDLVVIGATKDELQQLLNTAEEAAARIGLQFNPGKCAMLHLGKARGTHQPLATTFKLHDH